MVVHRRNNLRRPGPADPLVHEGAATKDRAVALPFLLHPHFAGVRVHRQDFGGGDGVTRDEKGEELVLRRGGPIESGKEVLGSHEGLALVV